MKRLFRHFGKRGQSGQALVVLAIGFIGLLGFVGIVTDVSLLFIRYSTMRRAVDAASVAAAGQMRRVADSNPTDSIAQDEADSVANLNLAARQFIELYGLNPTNVIVETCRAQQVNRLPPPGYNPADPSTIPADWPWTPADRAGIALFLTDGAPNPAANEDDVKRYQELCTEDELKLVRVTAQIEAPTIFMRLLGYDTITLTESAISQTAVIDVVLVFDVSESMLNETSYDDWDTQFTLPDGTLTPMRGVRYTPPYIGYGDVYDLDADASLGIPAKKNAWSVILGSSQGWDGIGYTDPDPAFGLTDGTHGLNYMIRDTNLIPETSRYWHLGDRLESFEEVSPGVWAACNPDSDPQGACRNGTGRVEPREFCQVRAYPPSMSTLGASHIPAWLQAEYAAYYGAGVNAQFGGNPAVYSGFVPMYNYYGCCNDPNGDGDFGDLICQPFREARDAASGFLSRLDFLRGDRVAFVTFDRFATVIDPDGGTGPQSAMIETEYNLNASDGTPLRRGAQETLSTIIGVKTEASSYVDEPDDGDDPASAPDGDGSWDTLLDGGNRRTEADFLSNVMIGNIVDNPVYRACPYDKAVIRTYYTNAKTMPPNGEERDGMDTLINYVHTVPSWFTAADATDDIGFYSYEFRASCRGTNIGGALAAGSSTLYNTGRREGAVWIMVMLSDGAAGASNIVSRNGQPPSLPQPYALGTNAVTGITFNNPLNALGGTTALRNYPLPAETYGVFGLCPYGTEDQPSELLRDTDKNAPYCLDLDPSTRTFCGTVAQNPGSFALDAFPNCFEFYDVDDYARDWADWIGIADLPNAETGTGTGRVTDQLLPTIFTIGFGLNYDSGWCAANGYAGDYNCQRGITPYNQTFREDYLGEELLRYIADVGDNFQIDNDFWQVRMDTRIANSGEPGARGACEEQTPIDPDNPGATYQPLAPMRNCGNYFVAATGSQLEAVFNEIASRMFTRLSQ